VEGAHIDISLQATNKVLKFTVRNKFNALSLETKDSTSGIGLANVQRRLNLLYGTKQQLDIRQDTEWFVVSLQINLH
jgi:two-component system, LytTR family, sensor kinase